MDEEMYGAIPIANIENLERAPPVKVLKIPIKLFFWLNKLKSFSGSRPGTGIKEPSLKITTTNKTNRSLFFRFESETLDIKLLILYLHLSFDKV
jgi:hypothetical protein